VSGVTDGHTADNSIRAGSDRDSQKDRGGGTQTHRVIQAQTRPQKRYMERRSRKMSGFDLFQVLDGGDVLWYRATSDLAEAQRLAQEQAAKKKTTFFILEQSSQRRFFVDADGIRREERPSPA
jgi:hypothetical protein